MARNKHGTKVCPTCGNAEGTYYYSGPLTDNTLVTCHECRSQVKWSVIKP